MQNNNKDTNNTNTPVVFNFDNHEVRIINNDIDNPIFVAKDVCEILNLKNPSMAIEQIEKRLSDSGLKGIISNDTLVQTNGGKQKMLTINEQGLYELIFASRKKQAVKFRFWITGEVLPQLRKTGSYSIGDTSGATNQTTTPKLQNLTRTYAQTEDLKDECYITSTDIASISSFTHDELLDKLSLFQKQCANQYNPNNKQIEMVINTTKNHKPIMFVHHSVYLQFVDNLETNISYIINTGYRISNFYNKKVKELEDKNAELKIDMQRGQFFTNKANETIDPIIKIIESHKSSGIDSMLKNLQDYLKATYPKDSVASSIIEACLNLSHNENNLANYTLEQILNHIEAISEKLGATDFHLDTTLKSKWSRFGFGESKTNKDKNKDGDVDIDYLLRGFDDESNKH